MDNNLDLTGLRTAAQTAGNDVTSLISSQPGLLRDLRSSLSSLFAKDNPMMQQREQALQTYLNTPSQTRADLLPQNLPVVEGTHLNLSPTQQDAITTARSNAALVPLLGLNQSIVSQYGNIGDIMNAAANTYAAQQRAAEFRATQAQKLYENAIAEYNALTQRQNANLGANFFSGFGGGGGGGRYQYQGADPVNNLPAISSEGFKGSQNLFGAPESPGVWDTILGWLGATPRQGQQEETAGPNLSGYNFNNIPIKLGV